VVGKLLLIKKVVVANKKLALLVEILLAIFLNLSKNIK
jgi:hypothetical protein